MYSFTFIYLNVSPEAKLTLWHSEWPKLYGVLAVLSAIGLTSANKVGHYSFKLIMSPTKDVVGRGESGCIGSIHIPYFQASCLIAHVNFISLFLIQEIGRWWQRVLRYFFYHFCHTHLCIQIQKGLINIL